MVHAISNPILGAHPHLRLDRQRILAGAAAIVANAGLLMLLLIPITAPQLLPEPVRPPEITWFTPIQPKPVSPVPAPVEPERPKPDPQPVVSEPVQPRPVEQPTEQPAVTAVASESSEIVSEPPAVSSDSGEPGLNAPASGVRLAYAHAPAPAYPREALLQGIDGTVLLEVLVDTDGRPLEVDIARSSGNRDLDRAARRQVLRHWLFEPAMRNGQPVQARGLVPIAFSLD